MWPTRRSAAIVSFSVNGYGNKKEIEVIDGFDINKKSGWGALGPDCSSL